LLSEIAFGSFLVYAPRGTSETCGRAKHFVLALKEERPIGAPAESPSGFAARRLAEERPYDLFREIFDRAPLLVPVPRSSLRVDGGIWPALNIASALTRVGVGGGVLTALERIAPIAKSAFAARGSRPRPIDHYETIRATRLVTDRPELCLVDDVVTKGSTLIAAASRLQEVYPEARIVAFALIRTMGFVDDIDRIIEPTTGLITWSGDEADRNP
jgi:hypothetical protein